MTGIEFWNAETQAWELAVEISTARPLFDPVWIGDAFALGGRTLALDDYFAQLGDA